MILIINTTDAKKVFIGLANKSRLIAQKEFTAQYQQAEKLLPEIDGLLKKQACQFESLKAIFVVSGPGPFTALRIGVVTANTLSWALKIPVIGLKLNEFKNEHDLTKKGLRKLRKTEAVDIIEPFYGKKPNITIRRRSRQARRKKK